MPRVQTPGPVAADPSGQKLVLERERDSPSVEERVTTVSLKRTDFLTSGHRVDDCDALACHLLSLSAALIEADRHDEVLPVLEESQLLLGRYTEEPQVSDLPEMTVLRLRVLLAANFYNAAVLFLETGEFDRGRAMLGVALAKLYSVPETLQLNELYRSFEPRLSGLARFLHVN